MIAMGTEASRFTNQIDLSESRHYNRMITDALTRSVVLKLLLDGDREFKEKGHVSPFSFIGPSLANSEINYSLLESHM